MMQLNFQKGQGLGNDYLVIDATELDAELSTAQIRFLCDRHCGIGSDGILLADVRGADGDVADTHAGASRTIRLRILNPDGTEAEKSGNGLRIFGAYLHGRGIVGSEWFHVQLVKDRVAMRVEEELANGELLIRVEMGTASFDAAAVAFNGAEGDVLAHAIELQHGRTAEINTVSLSNPHCVVFTDILDRADFLERAPQLCTHPLFANGTNVQFARVLAPDTLEAWIWERGAGETLASGSSACAVAAAAVRRGLVQPGTFEVRMQGGSAEVDVDAEYNVKLRGPAQIILQGSLSAGALQQFRSLQQQS
jgi:diaminopimelate epimerase